MDNLNLIISTVIAATIVFVLARMILLWLLRKQVFFHAEKLYTLSLKYIGNNKLELLTTRQAFYDAVLTEQKVYKAYVEKLSELLIAVDDPELHQSLEFLKKIGK